MTKIGKFLFNSGDLILCKIKGVSIVGKIHIQGVQNWICHDNKDFDGSVCPNKYEYKFSWTFYIKSDGLPTDDVNDVIPFKNLKVKEGVEISEELMGFIKMAGETNYIYFNIKSGIFDDFVKYNCSDVEGNIVMETKSEGSFKPKKVEIKLSRFLRQVSNRISSSNESFVNLSDKEVEVIYNKYVSYQSGSMCELVFYSGDQIKEAYRSNNYLDGNSTLHKSCMTDRLEDIGIYIDNPDQVKIAVLKIDNKVAARSLVWSTVDGGVYSDRIYYAQDWMEDHMLLRLKKVGITPISKEPFKIVQLKKWKFKYNPYLDSFYTLDSKSGQLLYIGNNTITLRSAGMVIDWQE